MLLSEYLSCRSKDFPQDIPPFVASYERDCELGSSGVTILAGCKSRGKLQRLLLSPNFLFLYPRSISLSLEL